MGNSSSDSAGSLNDHIEQAKRTGVCVLRSRSLPEVRCTLILK